MADISTGLPQLDLAAGATIEVDAGSAGALVTALLVYGTYFPPAAPAQPAPIGEWLTVPANPEANA